jgi:hypothetical protein
MSNDQARATTMPADQRRAYLILEWIGITAIMIGVLASRLVGIETIEQNVLPDEADHTSLLMQVAAGVGPGPFDLSWDGNPAFSLYPALPLLYLMGPGHLSLRLTVTLAMLAIVPLFYLVCRWRCSRVAAFTATALLAGSSWALFFSRNGEVNLFIVLYTLAAVWFLQRAIDGVWWGWIGAGVFAGMGWYGFLGGVLILPIMLLGAIPALVASPARRKQAFIGCALMCLVSVVIVAPRLPTLIERWDDVQRYISGRSLVVKTAPEQLPQAILNNATTAVRAYLLLDPTVDAVAEGARYTPRRGGIVDSLSGTLYVIGLGLALWNLPITAPWLAMLALPIMGTQIATVNTPDIARAIGALPAIFLLAGLAIDRLIAFLPFRPMVWAACILSVGYVGWLNFQSYSQWQRTPGAAADRQPALEYAEMPAWLDAQRARIADRQRVLTVTDWRATNPAPTPAAPVASGRRPVQSSGGELQATLSFKVDLPAGLKPVRGLAAVGPTSAMALDESGRLVRIDLAAKSATEVRHSLFNYEPMAWDLAAGPDGALYIMESERGVVIKTDAEARRATPLATNIGTYRSRGMDVDATGRIAIADTGRSRVPLLATDGRLVVALGGENVSARDRLEQPTDVAFGADGILFVAVPEASKVVVLDDSGQRLGDWAIAKSSTVDSTRVIVMPNGTVAVCEIAAKKVRFFDHAGRELGQIAEGLESPTTVAHSEAGLLVMDRGAVKVFALSAR